MQQNKCVFLLKANPPLLTSALPQPSEMGTDDLRLTKDQLGLKTKCLLKRTKPRVKKLARKNKGIGSSSKSALDVLNHIGRTENAKKALDGAGGSPKATQEP